MSRSLSLLLWGAMAALTLGLLARNILAIPVLSPLDPNEGWNAAHALSLLRGQALYPSPQSLMVNNYPPLSFYLVAAITGLTGDAVIAGRILALLAFLAAGTGLVFLMRQMGGGRFGQICAALFFATNLLITSDYVAMADPQLLGHALQLAALFLLLNRRICPAALVFAASLFVKHNLLALPLASLIWLWMQDRHNGWRFAATGIAAVAAGLIVFQLSYGVSLATVLSSPRLTSLSNVALAVPHLWWAPLPLATLAVVRAPWKGFCFLYAGLALLLGLVFSAGDGVDANAFFDLVIACALAIGLVANVTPFRAALCALPLPLFLAFHFHDNNFFFTRDFRQQSARNIAFLASRPGPALCEQLSLCLWAGKGAAVDVFNAGEQIKIGARDPAPLIRMITAHHFAVLQLEDLGALGTEVRAAIARNYRRHHSDDNGTFFTPAF